jgi:hypothetical protein
MDDFLKVLNREPIEKTEAMAKGDEFEKWAIESIDEVRGGVYQYSASKQFGDYLLYGRIDVLKAGIIYDIKYTGNYEVGKFYGSYQTLIYLELVPEAQKMVYLIGNNGENIYREEYTREDCEPVENVLRQFEQWLKVNGLYQRYAEKWRALS